MVGISLNKLEGVLVRWAGACGGPCPAVESHSCAEKRCRAREMLN